MRFLKILLTVLLLCCSIMGFWLGCTARAAAAVPTYSIYFKPQNIPGLSDNMSYVLDYGEELGKKLNNRYSAGYDDGFRDANKIYNTDFVGWAFRSVGAFFKFEIMPGLTIGYIWGGIFLFMLAIWVLKMVAGG